MESEPYAMEESYEEESFVSLPLATDESLPICSDDDSMKHNDSRDDTLSIASLPDGDILGASANVAPVLLVPFSCSTPTKLSDQPCSAETEKKRKRKKLPVRSAMVPHDHISDRVTSSFNHSSNSMMGNLSNQSSELTTITGVEADKHNWRLSSVLNLDGCTQNCAITEHMLNEHSILSAHSQFSNKSMQEQNAWVIEYFNSHCPFDVNGMRDFKSLKYTIHGRQVCLTIWLEILSISHSRFYRLRADFVDHGGISLLSSQQKSPCIKTSKAVAWMRQYFERIGDKRPDKEGIYLPTCLTRKRIYEIMTEEFLQVEGPHAEIICMSQFDKLFNREFKEVTIPKVKSCCFYSYFIQKAVNCIIVKLVSMLEPYHSGISLTVFYSLMPFYGLMFMNWSKHINTSYFSRVINIHHKMLIILKPFIKETVCCIALE